MPRSVSAVSVSGQCLRDLRDLHDLHDPRPLGPPASPPSRRPRWFEKSNLRPYSLSFSRTSVLYSPQKPTTRWTPTMPKHYPPTQKQEALRPLDLYDNNFPLVQRPTGIPSSTLHDWRKQQLPDNPDLSGQKKFSFPENIRKKTERVPKIAHPPPPTQKPHCTYTVSIPFRDFRGGFAGVYGLAVRNHLSINTVRSSTLYGEGA